MTGTVDERLAALPPGPYRLEWPAEQGGLFTVWGRPKEDGGWAIPLVASGVQSVMEWLADHLNRLADSGVVLVERDALDGLATMLRDEIDRAHAAGQHEYERGLRFAWNPLVAAISADVSMAAALRESR